MKQNPFISSGIPTNQTLTPEDFETAKRAARDYKYCVIVPKRLIEQAKKFWGSSVNIIEEKLVDTKK